MYLVNCHRNPTVIPVIQHANMSDAELAQYLGQQLGHCMLRERAALKKRLHGLRQRIKQGQPARRGLEDVQAKIIASLAESELRRQIFPKIEYPDLPVCEHKDAIADLIRQHQVVIIAGETGSGKTTQLPKICVELGLGIYGSIGHTQPRRIAARSVAMRIASELQTQPGDGVGYKVRFSDQTQKHSRIKLMTDGIMLAEMPSDPMLLQYDTIIIDEAHERSLNIDFLLGYLKKILPKRHDLKVIITSATINTQRFSAFFDGAPVLEVSGRSYPVDIVYHPVVGDEDDRDRDLPQAIVDAVHELGCLDAMGDILVFLPGEREIREAEQALQQHSLPHTEIVPLYSRLSPAEQDKVFQRHAGRRIVLATNVAETSLTVPGIRFVVDTGLARISRYSPRTKVQRLPIEPISQASANQRAGRCGRVSHGVCMRLYAEEHFAARSAQTDPEILRTNLASVILQMASLGLGDIAAFPLMDVPDMRAIRDGYRLLEELQAVDANKQLTTMGRKLARMPLDPRMARMLLAAHERRSLHEVLIIVAALSVQDPRLRPAESRQQADDVHRIFSDENSDFLSWLKLWQWYHEQARHLSRSKLRKLCHERFLSYVRMREWHDLHGQLLGIVRELAMKPNEVPASADEIHQALLSGLLSHVAVKTEAKDQSFLGARGLKLSIFPGSSQFKKPPKWIMAAELVETSRLFARTVAMIDPAWLEVQAAHCLKRDYGEAYWSSKRAQVLAVERMSLFGLIIGEKRVHYGPIDSDAARQVFIRSALVQGEFRTHGKFFEHNSRCVAEIERMEAKSRRRDLLLDEEARFAFFDAVIPDEVYSGKLFEQWRKKAEASSPRLLYLDEQQLLQGDVRHDANDYPDVWQHDGLRLQLEYHFDPSHHADGVTLLVPLAALGQLQSADLDWLVPGMLEEKLAALLKTLPKSWRKHFVPVPSFAEAAAQAMAFAEGHLLLAFSQQLKRMTGVDVPLMQWHTQDIPKHLRMNYRVLDGQGKALATSDDLPALQQRFASQMRAQVKEHTQTQALERRGLRNWDVGDLPDCVELQQGQLVLRRYPALVDDGESVSLQYLETSQAAQGAHKRGVCRLLMLAMHQQVSMLQRQMPGLQQILLHYATMGDAGALKDALIWAAFMQQFLQADVPRTADAFELLLAQGRAGLMDAASALSSSVAEALSQYHTLQQEMAAVRATVLAPVVADIRQQMQHIFCKDFVSHTPAKWLEHFPRYVEAARLRLQKAGRNKQDTTHQAEVTRCYAAYETRKQDMQKQGIAIDTAMQDFRWLIEELRVSLFAQELGTSQAVSVKRLRQLGYI